MFVATCTTARIIVGSNLAQNCDPLAIKIRDRGTFSHENKAALPPAPCQLIRPASQPVALPLLPSQAECCCPAPPPPPKFDQTPPPSSPLARCVPPGILVGHPERGKPASRRRARRVKKCCFTGKIHFSFSVQRGLIARMCVNINQREHGGSI